MKEDNVNNPPAEPGILSFGTLATTHDELRRSLIQELNDIKSSNQKSHQEICQAEATRNKIQYEFKERIPAETQSLTRSMAHLTENQSIHKQFFSELQHTMKVHVLATDGASATGAALVSPDAGYRSETTSEGPVPGEDGFVNSKENKPSPGTSSLISSEENPTITKIADIRSRHTTLVDTFVRLEENRKKGEQSLQNIASRYQQLQGQWVDLSDRIRREDTAGQLRAIENDISHQRHRGSEEDKRGTTLKQVLGKARARVEQACHKEHAQVCKANRMNVFSRRPIGLIDAWTLFFDFSLQRGKLEIAKTVHRGNDKKRNELLESANNQLRSKERKIAALKQQLSTVRTESTKMEETLSEVESLATQLDAMQKRADKERSERVKLVQLRLECGSELQTSLADRDALASALMVAAEKSNESKETEETERKSHEESLGDIKRQIRDLTAKKQELESSLERGLAKEKMSDNSDLEDDELKLEAAKIALSNGQADVASLQATLAHDESELAKCKESIRDEMDGLKRQLEVCASQKVSVIEENSALEKENLSKGAMAVAVLERKLDVLQHGAVVLKTLQSYEAKYQQKTKKLSLGKGKP
jgi:chromosome segregation ATPase